MGTPNEVLRVLHYGGVVILPTETVYGLAARADNDDAIERLYAIKGRDFHKPLALCISNIEMARDYGQFNETAEALATAHWPGPLTLVLPVTDTLSAKALMPQMFSTNSKGESTIAIRCPDVEWRNAVTDYPVALTSANKSGGPDPVTAKDAVKAVGYEVDDIWMAADCTEALPSTIVTLAEDTPKILREGALPHEALTQWGFHDD